MPVVIGITGPAGSGKSTLAAAIGRYGFKILSLDELGHGVLEQPKIKECLVEEFSTAILRITDGAVSRRKLADMVFKDPRDMRKLNNIVHPPLIREAEKWITERRRRNEAGLVEGALVYEFGLADKLDGVIVVDAPFDVRLKRLRRTRRWDAERLTACDGAQRPVEWKIETGGIPFHGDMPLEEAAAALKELLETKRWLPQNGEKT